jgi:hypothetical protein
MSFNALNPKGDQFKAFLDDRRVLRWLYRCTSTWHFQGPILSLYDLCSACKPGICRGFDSLALVWVYGL